MPTREIIDYAQNNDISLIAIATHGLSGLREIALGSTAEYVHKNSGLPVLMITPKK
jgi:nucleotide-binding universal stress UspA family protein